MNINIKAKVKTLGWDVSVTEIDFINEELEVDLSNGNGDTSLYKFDEVELDISDGFHTFKELYFHRMILFSIICNQNKDKAWKSKLHHDGSMYNDYFIVGIKTTEGEYAYHFHIDNWNYFDIIELNHAPKYDGHKPKDITRLLSLLK